MLLLVCQFLIGHIGAGFIVLNVPGISVFDFNGLVPRGLFYVIKPIW
jgi:hypothetical protein